MESSKIETKLALMKKMLLKKQKKLKKLDRLMSAKQHVKQKLEEQALLNDSSYTGCLQNDMNEISIDASLINENICSKFPSILVKTEQDRDSDFEQEMSYDEYISSSNTNTETLPLESLNQTYAESDTSCHGTTNFDVETDLTDSSHSMHCDIASCKVVQPETNKVNDVLQNNSPKDDGDCLDHKSIISTSDALNKNGVISQKYDSSELVSEKSQLKFNVNNRSVQKITPGCDNSQENLFSSVDENSDDQRIEHKVLSLETSEAHPSDMIHQTVCDDAINLNKVDSSKIQRKISLKRKRKRMHKGCSISGENVNSSLLIDAAFSDSSVVLSEDNSNIDASSASSVNLSSPNGNPSKKHKSESSESIKTESNFSDPHLTETKNKITLDTKNTSFNKSSENCSIDTASNMYSTNEISTTQNEITVHKPGLNANSHFSSTNVNTNVFKQPTISVGLSSQSKEQIVIEECDTEHGSCRSTTCLEVELKVRNKDLSSTTDEFSSCDTRLEQFEEVTVVENSEYLPDSSSLMQHEHSDSSSDFRSNNYGRSSQSLDRSQNFMSNNSLSGKSAKSCEEFSPTENRLPVGCNIDSETESTLQLTGNTSSNVACSAIEHDGCISAVCENNSVGMSDIEYSAINEESQNSDFSPSLLPNSEAASEYSSVYSDGSQMSTEGLTSKSKKKRRSQKLEYFFLEHRKSPRLESLVQQVPNYNEDFFLLTPTFLRNASDSQDSTTNHCMLNNGSKTSLSITKPQRKSALGLKLSSLFQFLIDDATRDPKTENFELPLQQFAQFASPSLKGNMDGGQSLDCRHADEPDKNANSSFSQNEASFMSSESELMLISNNNSDKLSSSTSEAKSTHAYSSQNQSFHCESGSGSEDEEPNDYSLNTSDREHVIPVHKQNPPFIEPASCDDQLKFGFECSFSNECIDTVYDAEFVNLDIKKNTYHLLGVLCCTFLLLFEKDDNRHWKRVQTWPINESSVDRMKFISLDCICLLFLYGEDEKNGSNLQILSYSPEYTKLQKIEFDCGQFLLNSHVTLNLTDGCFLVSGTLEARSYINKYSLYENYTKICPVKSLENVEDTVTSLSNVRDLCSAVAGLSISNIFYIWNHHSGILLSSIDLAQTWLHKSSISNVYIERGYFAVQLLSNSENCVPGCLLAVNPESHKVKLLCQYEIANGNWAGLKKSAVIGDTIIAVDKCCTMYYWNCWSGDLKMQLSDVRTFSLNREISFLSLIQDKCIHVYNERSGFFTDYITC